MGNTMNKLEKKYHDELVDLTCNLVNIPTENHPPGGDEAPGQEFMKRYFERMGFEVDEYSPQDLPEYRTNPLFIKRDYTGRHNMNAVWKGTGGGRSLLLSGHMDVAPRQPLPWTVTEPFSALVKDGRIYGRGTADMKGGVACAVTAVKMLRERGFVPKGDIILETVVDEEYAGANGTLAGRMKGYNADFAINMEPSGLDVCPACVGAIMLNVEVGGEGGMPYTGDEVPNPAYDIADILQRLREFGRKREKETVAPALWDKTIQKVQLIITKVKAGEAYEYGQLAIPDSAWCEVVIQYYPGEDENAIIEEMTRYIKAGFRDPGAIRITSDYRFCIPGRIDAAHPGVQTLAQCVQRHGGEADGIVRAAMFSCDLGMFEASGVPAMVFGPRGGNLHARDEWVDIESLEVCTAGIADMIVEWCG